MGGERVVSRRLMLHRAGISNCPYNTNGLIFWLDGIEKGQDPTIWEDQIGNKDFTLSNCTFGDKYVQFANNSIATLDGAVSSDWTSETIEVCSDGGSRTGYAKVALFSQPMIDDHVGAAILLGSTRACSINADGTTFTNFRTYDFADSDWTVLKRLSLNADDLVLGENICNNKGTDSWGANQTGKTFIARRNDTATSYIFVGKIYSIRIYNRKLSTAEMIANQAVDAQRFFS